MITLSIDGNKIEAARGANLLKVCLDNDIYIPNLCYLEGMERPPASCRLCFVEIEGEDNLAPACSTVITEEMVVRTDSERVRQLQKSALQLLLSVHDVDCKNCPANRKCALQDIAKFVKIALKTKRLNQVLKENEIDQRHPFLDYYPNRCVLCGRCVFVCRQNHSHTELTFANRGFDTVIRFYGRAQSKALSCDTCQACATVCPVAALLPKT